MEDAELDRILSNHDEIQPSSGFVAAVMEAVEREAAAPAPIPFPWRRALPLFCLGAIALVSLIVIAGTAVIRAGNVMTRFTAVAPETGLFAAGGIGSALAWTGLALVVAFISVMASMRMVGSRG